METSEQRDDSRLNRMDYWKTYAISSAIFAATALASVFYMSGKRFDDSVLVAIASASILLLITVYMRVMMMRRCKDIDWHPALPWISYGLCILAAIYAGFMANDATFDRLSAGNLPLLAILLADFVFSILIGCFSNEATDNDFSLSNVLQKLKSLKTEKAPKVEKKSTQVTPVALQEGVISAATTPFSAAASPMLKKQAGFGRKNT